MLVVSTYISIILKLILKIIISRIFLINQYSLCYYSINNKNNNLILSLSLGPDAYYMLH